MEAKSAREFGGVLNEKKKNQATLPKSEWAQE